ncbi:PilZ domain-containing protein [Natronospirillum operosum]|uniref:PilZ domain-containing protein n=1 Tax=Natronospirillum operosum TaxID=2759953 RepID=A0A4Z0WI67_9GAMM|nr:PilZ domain-containing protein [Natronospirillum operosum]TGG95577.1 PilZ domain-containing protein [Natronospirillum operosum]
MEYDRRAYFRIEDVAWVLTASFAEDRPSVVEYFPQLRHVTAENALAAVDQELKELSEHLDEKALSRYVRALNRKIDLFRQNLLIQQLDRLDEDPQTITVSEGGLSFWSHQAYKIGDRVAMALVFSPSYLAIYPRAEIVNCEPDTGGYNLHAAFVDMPEPMRQQLARHLLSQQTAHRT